MEQTQTTGTTAIVIGGSIAGMCAAKVLSRHCERVIVVDRDAYPAEIEPRNGVPQSRHSHALLDRGRQDLEALFPGFDREMRARGALELDPGLDFAVLQPQGWRQRAPLGIPTFWSSRELLESVVRDLLRPTPKVELIERAEVTALSIDRSGSPSRPRVTGVKLRQRDGGQVAELRGDLVVDASGRSSRVQEWLKEHGIAPPPVEEVDPFVGYSSRWYEAPPRESRPSSWWWTGMWVEGVVPDVPRGGVLVPCENGRWLVTLMGVSKDYPPTDVEGFERYMRELRSPAIAHAVALAKPISRVTSYRSIKNRFHRYDRWRERVGGLLVTGDAACAFNSVYGQGMASAAASARILDDTLTRHGARHRDLAARFHRAQTQFLQVPWSLATSADLRWPETAGARPLGLRMTLPYGNLLADAGFYDLEVGRELAAVYQLVRNPLALMRPGIVARVLGLAMSRAWTKAVPVIPQELPPDLR